ncbi:glycine zipper 2TM domain-containing protein [Massilia arenosa]|uniref:Glycine zipper 2TM domain-containing protein n=1 Tax=Zemynaea arenosa TaxID=2561931 RepID=A0A4Y9SDQ3_9BURK|nr:glycine zipper 2TM domain-containing protein [Massilia arenosa]TFW17935.1 glycine zipper 2TM domain-containing protein [Massilia arenosa]
MIHPTRTLAALVVAGTAVLAGCSTAPSTSSGPTYSSYDSAGASSMYGTIDSITVTRTAGTTNGSGALIGGVVGGLVGNQVGSGSGRTAATAAGALAGAVVGNNMEAKREGDRDMYQVSVRLDNGDYRTVVQDSVYDLRVGNRVRIVDGRVYRY